MCCCKYFVWQNLMHYTIGLQPAGPIVRSHNFLRVLCTYRPFIIQSDRTSQVVVSCRIRESDQREESCARQRQSNSEVTYPISSCALSSINTSLEEMIIAAAVPHLIALITSCVKITKSARGINKTSNDGSSAECYRIVLRPWDMWSGLGYWSKCLACST